MTAAKKAVKWAVEIANDDSHGYDQANRWGADYDCSSLVISAYQRAGIPLTCTYTGNMKSDMLAHGFYVVTDHSMQAGDILLNEANHAAMYIGNHKIVQASINEKGTVTGGQTGDQTGNEICIKPFYDYPWDCVLRLKAEDKQKVESDENKTYTVQKGDSLSVISFKTGISIWDLIEWNGISNPNLIHVGQILKLEQPSDKKEEAKPSEPEDIHIVAPGDNLWSLCVKYYGSGSLDTINALKDRNGLLSDTIYPGQILKLK